MAVNSASRLTWGLASSFRGRKGNPRRQASLSIGLIPDAPGTYRGPTPDPEYSHIANSPLVEQIAFRSNSTVRMTTTKRYDLQNRLTEISSAPAAKGAAALTCAYGYSEANQRVRVSNPADSYWLYDYDRLGQVIGAKRFWNDGTPVAGQQHEYAFDDIGNRIARRATPEDLRPARFPDYPRW